MYEYRQVVLRMRLGETDRALAKTGLMGRRKLGEVRRVAESAGWLDPARPLPDDSTLAGSLGRRAVPVSSVSLVEPYAEDVTGWWRDGIAATTIAAALKRKHGFTGSYSSVRRFVQHLDAAHPEVTVVLEFAPGESAQVDFGKGPEIVDPRTGELVGTWVFVMTLAWSRHQYAEFVTDQKTETWLGCHRRAFEWFGGVPAKVRIDNAKCAITRACYHDPEVQRAYAECAEAYGFLIDACPPGDPKKKGRVEAGVKYVKRNFVPLREFRDLTDANAQLKAWILGEAGNRIHGTTHERPLTRFHETERHLLTSLPARAPELAVWARVKVHGNCHVQFEKCFYSVPFRLVRQTLWLKATETSTQVFRELELVAVHPRLRRPGSRHTIPEHLPPEALAYAMQDPQWCLKQSRVVGAACHALVERLFADRVLDNLHAAQGVVRLKDRFGRERLEAACRRALAFDNPRYRTVKTILHQGLDQIPLDGDEPALALPDAYAGRGRFMRDTATLFND
jgi:transposase